VAIAPPDQINALDLAADNSPPLEPALPHGDLAAGGANALQAAFAVQAPAATNQNADSPTSAAPATDLQNAGAQAMSAQDVSAQNASMQVVTAQNIGAADASDQSASNQDPSDQKTDQQDSGAAGGSAWIAQAFAALGGAVAAGVVAWFLIGAGPVRTYS
jgi:hypothetical protein